MRQPNESVTISPINEELYPDEIPENSTLASIVNIKESENPGYYVFHKASRLVSNREKCWALLSQMPVNRYGFRGLKLQKGNKVRFG